MLPYTAVDMLHAVTANLVPEREPDQDQTPTIRQGSTLASTIASQYRRIKGPRSAT